MKNILHVIGYLGKGGDTTSVYNVHKYILKNNLNYHFDYVTHDGCNMEFVDKIRKNKSKVFILPGDAKAMGIIKYYKEIRKLLDSNDYDAIHFHTSFQSFVGLVAAKISGVKVRVCHSHTTDVQRSINLLSKKIILPVCRFFINVLSTKSVACSKEAGTFLFGMKNNFTVIHNGIDIDEFKQTDLNNVKKIIKDYSLNEKTVIGQVGVFNDNKNQIFTINLAKKLDKNKYVFLLIGEGKTQIKLKDYCKKNELDNVYFTGWVNNVNDYMNVFDFLLLPSRFGEGLPTVLIEEQILNKKCICISSDIVTREVDIGNICFLNLDNENKWIEKIKSSKHSISKNIDIGDFDINVSGNKWLNLYK